MNRLTFTAVLLAFLIPLMGAAQETAREDLPPPPSSVGVKQVDRQRWGLLGWTGWFGFPNSHTRKSIGGIKLGLPISASKGDAQVYGLELAAFAACTRQVNGMQLSPVNVCRNMSGFQMAFVNVAQTRSHAFQLGLVNNTARGFQVGLVNVADDAGFQFGLLNFNSAGFLPFFPFINF